LKKGSDYFGGSRSLLFIIYLSSKPQRKGRDYFWPQRAQRTQRNLDAD
jgi:hypothetical protein